jgi:hypothetical protein
MKLLQLSSILAVLRAQYLLQQIVGGRQGEGQQRCWGLKKEATYTCRV